MSNLDFEHLHHWMNAIRQSNNPMRTLDAFYEGQIKSKQWLINCVDEYIDFGSEVDIFGGWVGVLASMIFQSNIPVTKIRSIDIDPMCEHIAIEMNRIEHNKKMFEAITQDMCTVTSNAHLIINTSCEHLTQEQYDTWLSNMPKDSWIVVQGNNYDIPEHVRIAKDIHEFERQCNLERKYVGTLNLPLYDRYMIIGRKYN